MVSKHSFHITTVLVWLISNTATTLFSEKIAFSLGLPGDKAGLVASVHEFILATILCILLRGEPVSGSKYAVAKWISRAAFFLGLADLCYGIHFYYFEHTFKNTAFFMVHQGPYILGMTCLAIASTKRGLELLSEGERVFGRVSIVLLAAAYFYCSYQMVLSFVFPADYVRPFLNMSSSYAYAVVQSVAVGGLFVCSLRASSLIEFFFWTLFLGMNGIDFALRYQDVAKHIHHIPFFEYGWELTLVCLTSQALWISQSEERLWSRSPFQLGSIRVLTPLMNLGILVTFVGLEILTGQYFQVVSINTMTGHSLIFVIAWLLSNLMGIGMSRIVESRVNTLSGQLGSTQSLHQLGSLRADIVELNHLYAVLESLKLRLLESQARNHKLEVFSRVAAATKIVVHNIRSPLTALEIGLNSDAGRSVVNKSLSEIKRFVEELDAESKVVQAAPETNFSHEGLTYQPLSQLVRACVAQKQIELFNRPETELSLEIEPCVEAINVYFDKHALSAIISNLVNNSLDAVGPQGKIHVSLSKGLNDCVSLQIGDNGHGIPAQVLPEIGQYGFTYGKAGGTGLGLAHAIKTIQKWGGELSLESSWGVGTEIKVDLLAQAESVPFRV